MEQKSKKSTEQTNSGKAETFLLAHFQDLGQGAWVGAHGENKEHLQISADNFYPLSFALWEKHDLCAGKKKSLLLEPVQSHLLSFVVKVSDSDSKKGNA